MNRAWLMLAAGGAEVAPMIDLEHVFWFVGTILAGCGATIAAIVSYYKGQADLARDLSAKINDAARGAANEAKDYCRGLCEPLLAHVTDHERRLRAVERTCASQHGHRLPDGD